MRILAIILSLVSVAMVFSCNSTKDIPTISGEDVVVEIDSSLVVIEEEVKDTLIDLQDAVFMTYNRSYCFGMCPVFKSEITHDGTVSYQGINFVDNMGNHIATLNPNQLDELKQQVSDINYMSLDSVYNNQGISDLPSVTTSVTLNGESHSILDRWKGPEELDTLYDLLDDLYSQLDWKPLDNE